MLMGNNIEEEQKKKREGGEEMPTGDGSQTVSTHA